MEIYEGKIHSKNFWDFNALLVTGNSMNTLCLLKRAEKKQCSHFYLHYDKFGGGQLCLCSLKHYFIHIEIETLSDNP